MSRENYLAYQAGWNNEDADAIVATLTEDVYFEDVTLADVHQGRDAVHGFALHTFTTIPGAKLELVSYVDNGEEWASQWILRGKGMAANAGMPPSDKPWEVRGASVGKLAGGLISESHDYWNMVALLVQLGVMPAPEG
jgi:steroid delta-isomerase-like uncharacterized protein